MFFSVSFLIVLVTGAIQGYWPQSIAMVYVIMSAITVLVYKWDKRLAIKTTNQIVRVPERSLHILAILGGWPGALFAQQWFRHKSKKRAFIAVLWLTIIANSSVIAYLYYWQYS